MYKPQRGTKSGGWKGAPKQFGAKKSWDRGFNDRDADMRTMHSAVCGECGASCQVPFKPNGRKPVLCSRCFKKDDGDFRPSRPSASFDRPASGGADAGRLMEQLQRIEMKLDELLAAMSLKI